MPLAEPFTKSTPLSVQRTDAAESSQVILSTKNQSSYTGNSEYMSGPVTFRPQPMSKFWVFYRRLLQQIGNWRFQLGLDAAVSKHSRQKSITEFSFNHIN